LNWYRSTAEWKPFHHDAAAMKPAMAEKQNFTVAVSFGVERDAAFEHAKTKVNIFKHVSAWFSLYKQGEEDGFLS
jgi:hypothetical protein